MKQESITPTVTAALGFKTKNLYFTIRMVAAFNEKSVQRDSNIVCWLAVVRRSRNFRPAADPLPGGVGRPKFNQLEMVTTFT